MNEKDKQAVNQQRAKKSGSRAPKSNQKSNGQTDNGQRTNDLQTTLQERAQQTGLQLADNFQAASLMYAIQYIQSGQYGEKTTELLEAFTGGEFSPLEDWNLALEAATEVTALPPSLDSNGSSTSIWLEQSQETTPIIETTA